MHVHHKIINLREHNHEIVKISKFKKDTRPTIYNGRLFIMKIGRGGVKIDKFFKDFVQF